MEIYVKNPALKESFENASSLKDLYESVDNIVNKNILKLVTKEPKYNEKRDCYSLSFKGKSKLGSTKNTVLISE
jgi:hypothetical protein